MPRRKKTEDKSKPGYVRRSPWYRSPWVWYPVKAGLAAAAVIYSPKAGAVVGAGLSQIPAPNPDYWEIDPHPYEEEGEWNGPSDHYQDGVHYVYVDNELGYRAAVG